MLTIAPGSGQHFQHRRDLKTDILNTSVLFEGRCAKDGQDAPVSEQHFRHQRGLDSSKTNLTMSTIQPNRRPSGRFRQSRLSFFSWNIGQMNMVKWDMYRAWLHHQPVDCACIQDTGWSFTSEWQDDQSV